MHRLSLILCLHFLLLAGDPTIERLESEMARLAQVSGGQVGATAIHLETGRRASINGQARFPMASTFKVPIAVQLLDLANQGKVRLDQMVDLNADDLHPGSGILTDLFNKPGVSLSVRNLMELMLLISDNSATDILLRMSGGGEAVTAKMKSLGLDGIRVDRPTIGMIKASSSLGPAAFADSAEDTATPEDMARLLAIVSRNDFLLDIMKRCRTGDTRLKGILPQGTEVAHKTGTISQSANDVGIITLPGAVGHVALAVFVKNSSKPAADRDRAIAEIARAVHDFFVFSPEGAVNYAKMAHRIVDAIGLQPGEKVFFGGDPRRFPELHEELMRMLPSRTKTLAEADVYLQLPGDTPPPELVKWTDAGGSHRQLHFHWDAGSLLADGVTQRHTPELDAIYYEALFAKVKPPAELLHKATIRVTTPAGTDLAFQTGDRPINIQDGDCSRERVSRAKVRVDREIELPAGVMRIAPMEKTVNGTFVLPDGTKLRIKRGKVLNPVQGLPDEFREIGIGFNPKLVPIPGSDVLPYFGYGAGIVRLSLGDNEELGGAVRSGVRRWFFFPDATVVVNGKTVIRAGRLQGN